MWTENARIRTEILDFYGVLRMQSKRLVVAGLVSNQENKILI
jgi:hypothetical protein